MNFGPIIDKSHLPKKKKSVANDDPDWAFYCFPLLIVITPLGFFFFLY